MPKTKAFLKISREVSKTYLNKPVPINDNNLHDRVSLFRLPTV